MFAFRCLCGVAVVAGSGMTSVARAADPHRVRLLAEEALLAMPTPPVVVASTPAGLSWELLSALAGALVVSALVAAFFGTTLGLRRYTSFGRLREKSGWREFTYRFRSSGPLRIRDDTVKRMTNLIGELESLGSQIRERSAATARAPVPAPAPVPVPESAPETVHFRRRDVEETPPAAPRERGGRMVSRVRDRAPLYERARQLLREGHEPRTVRAATGLKLAELDLLRSVLSGTAVAGGAR